MRIGLDFDNTIVSYDTVFHQVALEWGLIPQNLPKNKLVVRNFLRGIGKEDKWTEMQGYVYGARMQDAEIYPDALSTILRMRSKGHIVYIVSHKTPYPFAGPKYDLHAAARKWIGANLCLESAPIFSSDNLFFELTKEEKMKRISSLACEIFIDDLPEILASPLFPKKIRPLLFDPERMHKLDSLSVVTSWQEIQRLLRLT